ncbi:MAG TPA: hypothetical protein VFW97_09515 [Acidimicrobiia bacterium]|nr:hypothetical protein [Acidimicrobiia bacterium]
MTRSGLRRFAGACGVTALVAGGIGLLASSPVSASGETVVAAPNANLTDGATISVTVTTTAATDSGVFVAVTQCGNADSGGTPLASTTADDCVGASGLGTSLVLVGFPSGAVAAGAHDVSLVAKKTGIGANSAQCIPMPPATLPCAVSAATATVSGAYTGPGYNFQATADISYASETTTTTSTTSTTTPTSTTAPSSTTTAPTSTTTAPTTTAPPSTTAPATTRTFTCTDIPIPASALLVSPNRCLTDGQVVQISAPAGSIAASGAVSAQANAFVLECNPDPAIPQDGSGCNLAGLTTPSIAADGSIAPSPVTVKTGQLGSNALSNCPPSQAQADAGTVTCIIAAASGPADPSPLSAGITFAGQSVVLPVDSSGNATVPPTSGSTGATTPPTPTVLPAPLAVTIAGRTLAFTGSNAATLWLLVIGIALVDLGYLAVSSTWTRKRRPFRRS